MVLVSQWKVLTDCMQSLYRLGRPNKRTYKKAPKPHRNPNPTASYFQMEEEHRLEGHMRSNVTDFTGCHLHFAIHLTNCGL